MKFTYALLAGLLLAGCAPTAADVAAPQQTAASQTSCASFPAALRACAPTSCGQPHLFVPSFTIAHRVAGMENGACAYSQSMPGEMMMACRLSESGRNELAAEMEAFQRTGEVSLSFSSADPTPDTAMTRECEIRDRNGDLIPWGTSQR